VQLSLLAAFRFADALQEYDVPTLGNSLANTRFIATTPSGPPRLAGVHRRKSMAQKTVIQLTDDLDGTRISGSGGTVAFGLDGVGYQIDLTEKNARKLRDILEPYVSSARRGTSKSSGGRRSPSATPSRDAQAIRSWARRNGYEVSERGRISSAILAAYEASPQKS